MCSEFATVMLLIISESLLARGTKNQRVVGAFVERPRVPRLRLNQIVIPVTLSVPPGGHACILVQVTGN
jgi:hypothetical protein